MLSITPGQEEALRRRQAAQFRTRAAEYLSERYGRDRLPPELDWPQFVVAGTRLGNRKGIHSEFGVLTLCELALVHGFAFHVQSPWAADILDASDAQEPEKVERLRDHLPSTTGAGR
ncbi:MAG: hypothetical protein JWQ76_8 [Ramlibacter sp.]|nr:hypothetical protein [Ramlibacter sp.]